MITDDATTDDGLADEVIRLHKEIDELQIGLATRQLIGQATGVIAGRLDLSTHDAWRVVRVVSSFTNRRVRDVARVVVHGHDRRQDPEDAALAAVVASALEAAVQRVRQSRDMQLD